MIILGVSAIEMSDNIVYMAVKVQQFTDNIGLTHAFSIFQLFSAPDVMSELLYSNGRT